MCGIGGLEVAALGDSRIGGLDDCGYVLNLIKTELSHNITGFVQIFSY